MKSKVLFLFLLVLTISGCDLIGDLFTKTIDTTLSVSHSFTVTTQNQTLKSAGSAVALTYVFSSSKDLSIDDNGDLEKYLDKIKSMSVESATAEFLNLQPNQTILTLSVKVDGTEVFTKTNITSANSAFVPEISSANLDFIAQKLTDNKKISVSVSGTTNTPAMTFGSNLGFEVEVEVKLL